MQTRSDLRVIVRELLQELKGQGLVYAELRFAPQKHTSQGLTQADAVSAALAGLADFYDWQRANPAGPDLHSGLILCLMRIPGNDRENAETLRVAKQFLGRGVIGLDLAGAEIPALPNRAYAPFFAQAREWGIPYTIHAGEAMGPDSIREALALGAKRIGHGIRCREDKDLVKRLADEGITLECCATSNLNTKAFDAYTEYPIKGLLHCGVRATLNTDNMSVSNTNLPKEYARLEKLTGLNRIEEAELYVSAAKAAFCSEAERARLLKLGELAWA